MRFRKFRERDCWICRPLIEFSHITVQKGRTDETPFIFRVYSAIERTSTHLTSYGDSPTNLVTNCRQIR